MNGRKMLFSAKQWINSLLVIITCVACIGGCSVSRTTAVLDSTLAETCSLCSSTRYVVTSDGNRSVKIGYRSPGYPKCKHVWTSGISVMAETRVDDGQIVLLKSGKALGAIVLRKQTLEPQRAEFDYYYRSDGKGTFRRNDGYKFTKGHGKTDTADTGPGYHLAFARFRVIWLASATKGEGVFSYSHFPGDVIAPNDTRFCITKETDIEKIDATNKKWIYKASPSDPGVSGSAP